MTEILSLGFVLLTIPTALHLRALKKHDFVLFRFCQIRRELIAFLRDQALEMPKSDYVFARNLLESLNHTIHNYREGKARIFNLRHFARFLRVYNEAARELKHIPQTDNPVLLEFRELTGQALLSGFLCYTPFLRSEAVTHLVLLGLSAVAHLGLQRVGTRALRLKQSIETAVAQSQLLDGVHPAA